MQMLESDSLQPKKVEQDKSEVYLQDGDFHEKLFQ